VNCPINVLGGRYDLTHRGPRAPNALQVLEKTAPIARMARCGTVRCVKHSGRIDLPTSDSAH
jgi:hypothetical protein